MTETLVSHGGALPPGVVDTRPAGMRVIDIRDERVAPVVQPVPRQDSAPLDQAWLADRLRSVDAPAPATRAVPRPAGVEVLNGVLDTRPKGLALPADEDDDVEAHLVAFRPAPPAAPLPAYDAPWSSVLRPAAAQVARPARARIAREAAALVREETVTDPAVNASLFEKPVLPGSSLDEVLGIRQVAVPPAAVAEAPRTRTASADPAAKPSPYLRRSELRKLEAKRTARKAPTAALSVPQVGIASALGLATIAAPLTGALSLPAVTPSSVTSSAAVASASLVPGPTLAFPQVEPSPANAVESAHLVTDESLDPSVPAALQAPSRLLVSRASRGNERPVLPGCTGEMPDGMDSAQNGRLPAPMLCTLWDGDHKLRTDAAVALARLNVAYHQQFGRDLCLSDAYRTLSEQYAVKRQRGGYAATPGTSEHGWGLAIDLCGGSSVAGTTTFTWLRANAAAYGWANPDWAQSAGSGPYEPWHWEYLPGEKTGPGGD